MVNITHINQIFAIDEDAILGVGSTSTVYLGFLIQNHNKKYAIKEMDITKFNNRVKKYLLDCEIAAINELSLKQCKYIVNIVAEPIYKGKYIYLVMEALNGGSLGQYLSQHVQGIKEQQAIQLFKQILQGYRVIKESGIVHRDIKVDNFIFRKQINQNQKIQQNELCFIDFGYCKKQSVPDPPKDVYKVGSPNYMSPQAFSEGKYSQKSDIWALGVVLYEMLHGKAINQGMNMPEYFEMMKNGYLKNQLGITQPVWDLLLRMLAYNTKNRLNHKIIQQRFDIILRRGISLPRNSIDNNSIDSSKSNSSQPKLQPQHQHQNDIFANMMKIKQPKKLSEIVQISDKFQIDEYKILGKGAFGNVYLGHDKIQQYAVKEFDLRKLQNTVANYLFSCQISALEELFKTKCKYIVKTYEIIFRQSYCYMVMELLKGGSLADYIQDHPKGIEEKAALALFRQMIQAYGELKKKGIIHRDIKPDNLIFRKELKKTDDGQQKISQNELCLIDFGFCIKEDVPNAPKVKYKVGSPNYMSPQLYNDGKFSQKSDIWAMGVILYQMLHGRAIGSGMSMEHYFYKMQRGGIENMKKISNGLWQLMLGMLKYNVQNRFGYDEISKKLSQLNNYNNANANRTEEIPQERSIKMQNSETQMGENKKYQQKQTLDDQKQRRALQSHIEDSQAICECECILW